MCSEIYASEEPMIETWNADPSDVASIDAIITAAYEVISGPAGKKRDWHRERSLFISRRAFDSNREEGRGGRCRSCAASFGCRRLHCACGTVFSEERIFRKGNCASHRAVRQHCACLEHVRVALQSGR